MSSIILAKALPFISLADSRGVDTVKDEYKDKFDEAGFQDISVSTSFDSRVISLVCKNGDIVKYCEDWAFPQIRLYNRNAVIADADL